MAEQPRRPHPEACAEWQGALAAYVTAQGDPSQEAALLAHLEGCAACRAEADGLLAVAAVALVADPERAAGTSPAGAPDAGPAVDLAPPTDLGDRIAARVRAERRGHLRRRALVAAAGAAAAAAVLVGALVATSGDDGPARLDGEEFAFTVGEGEAVVAPYDDGGSSQVQLVATGLDPDLTYALWLSVPGGGRDERVPAGTFRPDDDGTVDVQLPCAMPAGEVGRVWATTPEGELALDTQ
jgi:hypothetical protein